MAASDSMHASRAEAKIRKASLADVPSIEALIEVSARSLGAGDYSAEQIDSALLGAWGVDTEIIRDGTYLVGEVEDELILCGGWSRRATLPGERLYARHGYVSAGRRSYSLPGGASIDFVPMRKPI